MERHRQGRGGARPNAACGREEKEEKTIFLVGRKMASSYINSFL